MIDWGQMAGTFVAAGGTVVTIILYKRKERKQDAKERTAAREALKAEEDRKHLENLKRLDKLALSYNNMLKLAHGHDECNRWANPDTTLSVRGMRPFENGDVE